MQTSLQQKIAKQVTQPSIRTALPMEQMFSAVEPSTDIATVQLKRSDKFLLDGPVFILCLFQQVFIGLSMNGVKRLICQTAQK
jgi:hypothetical protein